MQVKFNLSKNTTVYAEPDGITYRIRNDTGDVIMTTTELEELALVLSKEKLSRNDFTMGLEDAAL